MKLGNNSKMVVLGKGNIRLRNVGVTQVITDVFYIPELKNNMEYVESIIPRKGLLCKQQCLQTGCSYCLQKLYRKLPLASKQFLKTTLTFGIANMGI